jgi:hypothetical protein
VCTAAKYSNSLLRGARHRGRPPRRARVAVLLKIYAHCIDGQADAANQRITDALGTTAPEPGPGEEGDADSEPAA